MKGQLNKTLTAGLLLLLSALTVAAPTQWECPPVSLMEIPYPSTVFDWAPNGQWIACHLRDETLKPQIYRLSTSHVDVVRLTYENQVHYYPTWSPDGHNQWHHQDPDPG